MEEPFLPSLAFPFVRCVCRKSIDFWLDFSPCPNHVHRQGKLLDLNAWMDMLGTYR